MWWDFNENKMSFTFNATTKYMSANNEGTPESPISWEDYYQADQANGWGQITKTAEDTYHATCFFNVGSNNKPSHFDDQGQSMHLDEEANDYYRQCIVVRDAVGFESTALFTGEVSIDYEPTGNTTMIYGVNCDTSASHARIRVSRPTSYTVTFYQPSALPESAVNVCMFDRVSPSGVIQLTDSILYGSQNVRGVFNELYGDKRFKGTIIVDTPDDQSVLTIGGCYDTNYIPEGWDRGVWWLDIYEDITIKDTDANLFESPYQKDGYYYRHPAILLNPREIPNRTGYFPNYEAYGEPPELLEMYTFDPIIQYPDGELIEEGTLQAWDIDGTLRVNAIISNGRIEFNGYTEFPDGEIQALRAYMMSCNMEDGSTTLKSYNPYVVKITTAGKTWTFYLAPVVKLDEWPVYLFPTTVIASGIIGVVGVHPATGKLESPSILGKTAISRLRGTVSQGNSVGKVQTNKIIGKIQ